MTVSIILLIIATSGIFVSSSCFVDEQNDVKKYLILISTSIFLLLLSFNRKPISKLKQALNENIFSYGLITLSFLLSIQGALQCLGIIQSNHTYFAISGSFENPAGFAAIQSLLFIVSIYTFFKKKYNKLIKISALTISILAFITVTTSGSRCGFFAMSLSTIILIFTETSLKKTIKKHIWLILLFFIVLTTILYYLKEDSTYGRILIWRICINMIKDYPLFGFGYDGFIGNYMRYQAKYFETHNQSPYSILADNINHPFNEYIKLTVEYGILALILALLLLYIIIKIVLKKSNEKKGVGISLISTVLILSLFSYPFNYTVFTFIVILILIFVLPIKEPRQDKKYTIIKNLTRITVIIFASFCTYDCFYNYKWSEAYKRSLEGEGNKVMPYYKYLMSKISYNPYFLYNYSVELNYIKKYAESNEVARLLTNRLNDYDVQLLLADNNCNLQKYDEAIKNYETASYMIPSRFLPLEEIMNIYLLEKDTINAIEIAKKILSKPIKIPSGEVNRIRQDAEDLLNGFY